MQPSPTAETFGPRVPSLRCASLSSIPSVGRTIEPADCDARGSTTTAPRLVECDLGSQLRSVVPTRRTGVDPAAAS